MIAAGSAVFGQARVAGRSERIDRRSTPSAIAASIEKPLLPELTCQARPVRSVTAPESKAGAASACSAPAAVRKDTAKVAGSTANIPAGAGSKTGLAAQAWPAGRRAASQRAAATHGPFQPIRIAMPPLMRLIDGLRIPPGYAGGIQPDVAVYSFSSDARAACSLSFRSGATFG